MEALWPRSEPLSGMPILAVVMMTCLVGFSWMCPWLQAREQLQFQTNFTSAGETLYLSVDTCFEKFWNSLFDSKREFQRKTWFQEFSSTQPISDLAISNLSICSSKFIHQMFQRLLPNCYDSIWPLTPSIFGRVIRLFNSPWLYSYFLSHSGLCMRIVLHPLHVIMRKNTNKTKIQVSLARTQN